jgi:hypothetical protein
METRETYSASRQFLLGMEEALAPVREGKDVAYRRYRIDEIKKKLPRSVPT